MIVDGIHYPNVTCKRCRFRHPKAWSCAQAAEIAKQNKPILIESYSEEAHELYEAISDRVHDLVDDMLRGVPELTADDIRQRLTEQFRFWRNA